MCPKEVGKAIRDCLIKGAKSVWKGRKRTFQGSGSKKMGETFGGSKKTLYFCAAFRLCRRLMNIIYPLIKRKKNMIVVPVKEGENIERALKKFKRKYEKTGVVKELRRRQQFDKPSVLKRLAKEHAIYVQQLRRVED